MDEGEWLVKWISEWIIYNTVLSFKDTVLPAFLYSLVGVSLYGHSGVCTGRRQYPWLETPVSLRGNCSFPPGNGSSDVGNEDFNCRKINFDAWCGIFFLRFSYTVLQINGICNLSATVSATL